MSRSFRSSNTIARIGYFWRPRRRKGTTDLGTGKPGGDLAMSPRVDEVDDPAPVDIVMARRSLNLTAHFPTL